MLASRVSRPRIVIDGYNLIHATPELARLAAGDLERAREKLIARLAAYRSGRGVRITVVFDGQDLPRQSGNQPGGIEVVFSRAPRTADQQIKSMLSREQSVRSWTVVTSDVSIVRHARDLGALAVRSAEFAARLGKVAASGRHGRPATPEKPEMTPGDVPVWEEYFRRGRRASGS